MMRVRQLDEIRIALLAAQPIETSITAVAARFGVWDFSLFARNYKALYGETPSTTLKRPASPRDRRHAMDESWTRFAARKFQH
jgi:AraC family ethanolamine operon transcriptional activator